jgi:hypothetical protein
MRTMHMRALAAAVVTTGVLFAGCASAEITDTDPAAGLAGQPGVVLSEDASAWRHDPYSFQWLRVTADTLEVAVQYGGGCAAHDFTLVVSPVFMESYPVQMTGSLAHDARGDPCRAIVGRQLRFDLSPLKEAYRRAYGIESDTIILHVSSWPESVVYRF